MKYFVKPGSIVREIWGKGDTILFIFGGAAAEFALNKAVDWLYFTGKLPADPLGRLFSTVTYARAIVFATQDDAIKAIDKITGIHAAVESNRGAKIPDWAYRDVLYMLIHYSIAAYELLERKMSPAEKEELYDVFYRMGVRMQLTDLPDTYSKWLPDREKHLENDLVCSAHTKDLFRQYRKHLGSFRYWLLVEAQKLVIPGLVRQLLGFKKATIIRPILGTYKLSRLIRLDKLMKAAILPRKYKKEIAELDIPA